MFRVVTLVWAILFSWGPLQGQTPQQSCPAQTIPLSIVNERGEVPPTLNQADIKLELDHTPLDIHDLRLDTGQKRLVIVLDTSGSMNTGYTTGAAKIRLATTIAGDAITYLPSNVSIAFMTFDQKVNHDLDFSVPRQQVVSEVRDLQKNASKLPRGRTALLDALEKALNTIPDPAPGDVIYAITDGEDNSSHVRLTQFKRRLQRLGVRLYICLLRDYYLSSPDVAGIDDVTGLASASGGSVLTVPANVRETVASGDSADFQLTPEQRLALGSKLRVMYRLIANPYFVEVSLPAAFTKAESLRVTLTDPQKKKEWQLWYPHNVVSCR